MKKNQRELLRVAFALSLSFAVSCFGSSSGDDSTSTTSGTGTGAGTASNSSLSSIPSVDVSNLDSSQKASADIALPEPSASKEVSSLSVSKDVGSGVSSEIGAKLRQDGNASRAGCEANMHKKEIIRFSKEAQMDRCYIEAMEAGGLISIPANSFALYKLTPPEEKADERKQGGGKLCDDIPDQDKARKDSCVKGEGSHDGKEMHLRLGRFDDGGLKIDFCEGTTLEHEATYSVSGSVYSGKVVRIGNWGGNEEKASFDMTVDLGKTGTVSDGIVSLGDGTATATANMQGGFGSGLMSFSADGSSGANTIKGYFKGGFKDPVSGVANSFTGKVYATFDSKEGSAKFSFAGQMPAMSLKNMVPSNVDAAQLDNTLKALGAQLGIALSKDTYSTVKVCPNPSFDPENPTKDPTLKPMVAAPDSGLCDSVEHTGTESFTIKNAEEKGDFSTKKKQKFYLAASSAYLAAVKAFDLASLSTTVATPAFARNWDCAGELVAINFASATPELMTKMQSKFETCKKLQEDLNDNNGMGGHDDCMKQDQGQVVEGFCKDGPPSFGKYGGSHNLRSGQATKCPKNFLLELRDDAKDKYCVSEGGTCKEFSLVGGVNNSIVPNVGFVGDKISSLSFSAQCSASGVATVVFATAGTCQYDCAQPSFAKPKEFGASGGPTMPKACSDAKITPEHCPDFCRERSDKGLTCD